MVILLRSTDGAPDSRFEKYVNFLESQLIPYMTLCWDRYNIKTSSKKRLFYKKGSKYGLRYKNSFGLIGFNWFILCNLIRNRKKYSTIHAADFDTILPAMLVKLIYGKKVIYDIYDWYIDSRSIHNPILKRLIKLLERINITKSDVVIICEEGRRNQIIYKPKKLWILPNIPAVSLRNPEKISDKRLTISYVGILGAGRGLNNLIRLAYEKPNIDFIIGGFGTLENDFIKAGELPNVDFKGRVSYEEALNIMWNSDIIYAMYERINPNHILAAPNKYYEGLALGRPIITTTDTLVGDKVKEFNTGFCIDEKFESLLRLINDFNHEDLKIKSINAAILWENKYKNYIKDFMTNQYKPFLSHYK